MNVYLNKNVLLFSPFLYNACFFIKLVAHSTDLSMSE